MLLILWSPSYEEELIGDIFNSLVGISIFYVF